MGYSLLNQRIVCAWWCMWCVSLQYVYVHDKHMNVYLHFVMSDAPDQKEDRRTFKGEITHFKFEIHSFLSLN